MKDVRKVLVPLVALGGSAFLVVLLVSPILNPPKWDEYIVVYDAHRLLTGQVPYRDFFNFIPPGIFLALAALFKLAGHSTITLGRYAAAAVALGSEILAATALRRRGWALVPAWSWGAVIGVCLYPFWAIPSHHWFAGACFLGLLAVLAPEKDRPKRIWLAAGVLTGLAGLFLQTTGLLCGAVGLVLLAQTSKEGLGRRFLAFAGGTACVLGPAAVWLGLEGALGGFFRDTVLWPARNYSRGANENAGAVLQDLVWRVEAIWTRTAVHPSVHAVLTAAAGWILYFLLTVLAAGCIALAVAVLWRALKNRRLDGGWPAAACLGTFLAVGVALRGNVNWLHLVYLTGPLTLLWLAALGPWNGWPRMARLAGRAGLAALLAAGVLYGARGLWTHCPKAWELTDADRLIREQSVNRFLRSPGVLAPGDTVAAFPEGGEVYLYSAPAAVGYTYFTPLSQGYNDLHDHEVVARQIEKNRPKYILVTPDLEKAYLDPESPVGKVMRRDYERMGIVGNAVVYKRKGDTVVGR